MTEFNLLEKDDESSDNEFWTYTIQDDVGKFPFDKIYRMTMFISGVRMHYAIGNHREDFNPFTVLTLLESTPTLSVELSMYQTKWVRVTGIITNFAGSRHDVERFIDETRDMGLYSLFTFQRFRQPNHHPGRRLNTITGAVVTIQKIEIRKSLVRPALKCNRPTFDTIQAQEAADMMTLSQVDDTHERLHNVAKEYKTLVDWNIVLKACRKLIQNAEVTLPPNHTIPFNLETGHVETNAQGERVWYIEPTADENYTIPVSEIVDMRVRSANIPWNSLWDTRGSYPPILTREQTMIYKYSSVVSVIFLFDDSANGMDIESVFQHARSVLDHMTDGWPTEGILEREPHLTMRLSGLQIKLSVVQGQLDLLGVDTAADEGEEQSKRRRRSS